MRAKSVLRPYAARALVLVASCGLLACGEIATAGSPAATLVLPPGFEGLTAEQRAFLTGPGSPEAAAGRPATLEDLQAVRSWFGPGELEAVLATINRFSAARGEDTIPHCFPLCGTAQHPER